MVEVQGMLVLAIVAQVLGLAFIQVRNMLTEEQTIGACLVELVLKSSIEIPDACSGIRDFIGTPND